MTIRDTLRIDTALHADEAHPEHEYTTTEGPLKAWDPAESRPIAEPGEPPWERNLHRGRDGWERFDGREEAYWMRRKAAGAGDRAAELIARIVRLKHGLKGTGRDGPCEPDCLKCALEKELDAVRAARGSETAAPPRTTDGDPAGANRIVALESALRSLISRVRRTGGYASPEEQAALLEAELVLGEL